MGGCISVSTCSIIGKQKKKLKPLANTEASLLVLDGNW